MAATVAPAVRSLRDDDDAESVLGDVLGSYRLLALIGKGGMGRVYLAEHVKLGRKVALKLLKAEYAAKRDSVARFFQEARAVNTIRHRNIVDVTDFVELENGRTFIIMELLSGSNLGELVRREGPLPLHRSLGLLIQVCDALEAAHREGIVHRDLKPDNIFVCNTDQERDTVKLLDFGVAKLLYTSSSDCDLSLHTLEGSVVGTPAYMSPEQAGGTSVDHRSDIYALGTIMYELFTGQRVFEARSFGEFVVKHLQEIPIPPRDIQGIDPLPPGIETVIMRCLEKRPEHRYPTAALLREDLSRVMSGESTVALSLPAAERQRPSRWPWLGVVVLAGLVVAAAVWVLSPDDHALPPGPVLAAGSVPATATGPPAVPTTAPAAAPASAAAQAQLVEFVFRSDPQGAAVYASGEDVPLGSTSETLRVMRPTTDRTREFVFKLPGYRDQVVAMPRTGTPEVTVLLERLEAGPAVTPPPRRRGPVRPRRPGAKPGGAGQTKAATAPTGTGPTTAPPPKKHIDRVDTVDPFAE